MKNFRKTLIFLWFTEKSDFKGGGGGGGGSQKKNIEGGLPKRGGLGQFSDLRGTWQERGGGVFEGS